VEEVKREAVNLPVRYYRCCRTATTIIKVHFDWASRPQKRTIRINTFSKRVSFDSGAYFGVFFLLLLDKTQFAPNQNILYTFYGF